MKSLTKFLIALLISALASCSNPADSTVDAKIAEEAEAAKAAEVFLNLRSGSGGSLRV